MSKHRDGGAGGGAKPGANGGLARAFIRIVHWRSRTFLSGLNPYAVRKRVFFRPVAGGKHLPKEKFIRMLIDACILSYQLFSFFIYMLSVS